MFKRAHAKQIILQKYYLNGMGQKEC